MSENDGLQRALELFHRVVDLSEAERRKILDSECQGDPELRKDIEKLLDPGAAEAANRLDTGVLIKHAPAAVDRDATMPQGTGPYRVLRKIGEGGMADVFLAEQVEHVQRQVALKLVKLGMDTEQVLRRFDQERHALEVMDHPNVARVLDAGAAQDGRPYFVLEYVAGLPISDYCDRHQLRISERLGLFLQVCEAVQHAHQKGVIHRDIKPSNVLVTDVSNAPLVKVIDFGIAKAIDASLEDRTVLTRQGQCIGTPEYMSPEQAGLDHDDIDTRTDIYSLGVLLHEMLVGVLPFDSRRLRRSPEELLRAIRESDPARPSRKVGSLGEESTTIATCRRTTTASLERRLRGDLDWIILKALDKERNRRYANASDLASDIRRHLAHEPVLARRPTARYRLAKFVRRNRPLVGGGALAAVTLIAAVIVSLDFASRERAQRRIASRAGAKAVEREAEARTALARLERVVGFQQAMLTGVDVGVFGREIMEVVAEGLTEGLADAEVNEEVATRILDSWQEIVGYVVKADTARRLLDRELLSRAVAAVDADFADDPVTAASLRQRIGEIYGELGMMDECLGQIEKAWQLRRIELGESDADTLRSAEWMGKIHSHSGRQTEARRYHEMALEGRIKNFGEEHPTTLESRHSLAVSLTGLGQHEAARDMVRQVIAARRRAVPVDPDALSEAIVTQGLIARRIGDYAEARASYEEAIRILREAFGPDNRRLWNATHLLGALAKLEGNPEESVRLARASFEALRRTMGSDHPDTLLAHMSLAARLAEVGDFAEGIDTHRELLATCRRVLGHRHPTTLTTLGSLGQILYVTNERQEAQGLLRECLKLRREIHGDEHTSTAEAALHMGRCLATGGHRAEAEPYLREAVRVLRLICEDTHHLRLAAIRELGNTLTFRGRYAEAEPLIQEALDGARRKYGPDHPDTLRAVKMLARLYRQSMHYEKAVPLMREVFEKQQKRLGREHPSSLDALRELALVLTYAGHYAEAEPLCHEAVDGFARAMGPDHLETINALDILAKWYALTGANDKAVETYRRTLASARETFGLEHQRSIELLFVLGASLSRMGEYEEARSCLEEGIEMSVRNIGKDHPSTLTAFMRLAEVADRCGDRLVAVANARRALDGRWRAFGRNNSRTLQALHVLAEILQRGGRHPESEAYLRYGVDIARRLFGPDHIQTRRAVALLEAAQFFEVSSGESKLDARATITDLADLTKLRIDSTTGGRIDALDETLETRRMRDVHGASPARGESYRIHVSQAGEYRFRAESHLFNPYVVLSDATGRILAEDECGRGGVLPEIIALLDEGRDYRLDIISPYGDLGSYSIRFETFPNPDEDPAEDPIGDMLDMAQNDLARVIAETGDSPSAALGTALHRLATIQRYLGKWDASARLYQPAADVRQKTLGAHRLTAASVSGQSLVAYSQGEFDQARRLLEQSISMLEAAVGPEHPRTVGAIADLGLVLSKLHQYERAEQLVQRALRIRERTFGADHFRVAHLRIRLASIHIKNGNLEAARVELERVVKTRTARFGPDHSYTTAVAGNLNWVREKLEARRRDDDDRSGSTSGH